MSTEPKKQLPKGGGRKGGTQFPHLPLKQAVEYAKKLVSKIHTGPQSESVILKGVFNNSGPGGKIKASALKQYDLMTGLSSAYDATDLARAIHSAPAEELPPLLAQACLSPRVFKILFDTFHDDTVSRAKIRQQTLQLKVHPDTADKCVKIFIESLVFAQLATEKNGDIAILPASQLAKPKTIPDSDNGMETETRDEISADDESDLKSEEEDAEVTDPEPEKDAKVSAPPATAISQVVPKAQFQVALNLDTMDPEKLEKHLKILKRYGVIS